MKRRRSLPSLPPPFSLFGPLASSAAEGEKSFLPPFSPSSRGLLSAAEEAGGEGAVRFRLDGSGGENSDKSEKKLPSPAEAIVGQFWPGRLRRKLTFRQNLWETHFLLL